MIMNVTGSPVARKAAFFAMFLSLMPALDGNASEEPFRSASGVEDTRAHIARLPKTDIWWTRNGKDMAWNNRHLRAIFPAVPVYRASQVSELAYRLNPEIPTFTVSTPDGDMPFKAFLDSDQSTTMGIVILHRGDIVFEHYPRQQPYETPIFWSVTKAFVSTLVAILEDRGLVDVSRPIEQYIPELAGSSFAGVTVRNFLDMATGVDCPEEYEDRDSCYYRYSMTVGDGFWNEDSPDNPYTYLASVKVGRWAEQGTSFSYSGVNTFILGWLVETIEGMPFQDALSREIWTRIGAEGDASILAPRFGVPITHGGLMARLRDVARFGLLFTPSYARVAKERIVSERYVDLILNGGRPELLKNARFGAPDDPTVRHNVYQWDLVWDNGDFLKGGWAGQGLLINPGRDLVAVWTGYFKDDEHSEVELLPILRTVLNGLYGGEPEPGEAGGEDE
ncbi:MAG: serine hydrolase domain-containing protein [Lysobacterales bacterium]